MIYVQISSGRGPAECGLAISHIRAKMLGEWPPAKLIHGGGYQSSIVGIGDPGADLYVRGWEGTILWVCADPLHLGGRKRKNWYVGVRRIVMPDYVKVELRDADLVIDTMRASGKGGQRVNKVSSKVRMTHLPTGIVVISESQRSQQQNIAIAKKQMVEKLRQREDNIFAALETANWIQHNQLERGNPTRVFDGPGFVERR